MQRSRRVLDADSARCKCPQCPQDLRHNGEQGVGSKYPGYRYVDGDVISPLPSSRSYLVGWSPDKQAPQHGGSRADCAIHNPAEALDPTYCSQPCNPAQPDDDPSLLQRQQHKQIYCNELALLRTTHRCFASLRPYPPRLHLACLVPVYI